MKKIILAVAIAALASVSVAAFASAGGVDRYQTQSMTITAVQPEGAISQWDNVWTHVYNVTLNPCDGSFSGSGTLSGTTDGNFPGTESITGQLVGNNVSFTAMRSFDSVVYSLSNAPLDNSTVKLATSTPAVSWPLEFKVSNTTPVNTTQYKNHGDYVSQAGDKNDAAHSCIGMPVK